MELKRWKVFFPQFSELGTSRKGISDEGESVGSKDRVEKGPADDLECALFEYQKEREKGCVIYGGGGEHYTIYESTHGK